MRVLIVDDEPLNRLVLARHLSRWGHEPVQAADGEAAWELFQAEPFRLVVTDWMMPEMDGLELTRRIRLSPHAGYTYVLVVTARTGVQALVEGIGAGADDFVTKPFQTEELRARIRAGERVLQLESDLEERNRRLALAHASARADLEAAARMQRELLPAPDLALDAVRAAWRFQPAHYVAGDVFNVHALDATRASFYVLDVAGHGVASAMLSFMLSKLLAPGAGIDGLVRRDADAPGGWEPTPPAEVLRQLNARFQDDSEALRYFTMIYGIVDAGRNRVTLAQAGHPTPLLVRPGGGVARLGDTGFPVGMLPGIEYEQHEFPFEPDDRLLLFSDGVTDCAGEAGEAFGLERLERAAGETAERGPADAVRDIERRLRLWRGAGEFADDITLLALERRAA